jgi:DNA-binding NtrC family response regulator
MRNAIERVAPTNSRVLVTGPAGVGKEAVARLIHARSRRAQGPFVVMNCASMRPERVEVELFGQEGEDGAPPRPGLFEQAHGGTLLLDEVADMPLETQGKIVRALQEMTFERVGGRSRVSVDVRVMSTTSRELQAEIAAARFREDLLYRLNVVNLRLPSLRERPGDIIALSEHFVKKYAVANGMPDRPLSAEARRRLVTHRWPGNVRELENAMHRAVLLSSGSEIEEFAIRLPDGAPMSPAPDAAVARNASMAAEAASRSFVGQTVAQVEQQLILDTLSHCIGNRTHAATILGISIRTLRNKLKEYSEAGVAVPAPQAGIGNAA